MPQFTVDEELAALVEKLAKPKPFENLSFNSALNRVLESYIATLGKVADLEKRNNANKELDDELDQLLAESMAIREKISDPKKTPSPSPIRWAATVPELRSNKKLNTWIAICKALDIKVSGDSARRRLQNWVKANRPDWPPVPEPE